MAEAKFHPRFVKLEATRNMFYHRGSPKDGDVKWINHANTDSESKPDQPDGQENGRWNHFDSGGRLVLRASPLNVWHTSLFIKTRSVVPFGNRRQATTVCEHTATNVATPSFVRFYRIYIRIWDRYTWNYGSYRPSEAEAIKVCFAMPS